MITAKVELTQPLKQQRQFVALAGSGHDCRLDDAAGSTGHKPLEMEKYCSVGAMVQKAASFHTTYEIVEDKTEWLKTLVASGAQG